MPESSNEVNSTSVNLSDLFKFIPEFDGKREELITFIHDSNLAISLASDNQRPILLKYMISQIKGNAKAAICNRKFENWLQLKDYLKLLYQDKKHHSQLLNELTNISQKQSESISNFVQRLETLIKRTSTSIEQNTEQQNLLEGKLCLMNEIALNRFIHFTHPKISDRLRTTNPENLNEAITIAMAEEFALRMQNYNGIKSNKIVQKYCSTCNNNTHFTKDCFKNKNKTHVHHVNETQTSSSANSTQNQNEIKQCRYCKKFGHLINECRKREFNNKNKQKSTQKSIL